MTTTDCSARRLLLIVAATIMGAAGCQTYHAEVKTMAGAWSGNQLEIAAKQFGERADKESQSKDGVLWHLEAGAAQRAIGAYAESNRHFEAATAQVDDYEQQARVRVGQETMAVMSNQQNLPYVGRSYDKIMLHTYKALNHLTLRQGKKRAQRSSGPTSASRTLLRRTTSASRRRAKRSARTKTVRRSRKRGRIRSSRRRSTG